MHQLGRLGRGPARSRPARPARCARPRAAASRATPAPVMPFTTTRRSKVPVPRARLSSRSNVPRAWRFRGGDAGEPNGGGRRPVADLVNNCCRSAIDVDELPPCDHPASSPRSSGPGPQGDAPAPVDLPGAPRVDRPSSAEAVYEAVSAEMPTISLRTVYQTLNDLAAMGEIQAIDLGTGSARFDLHNDPHHHLVCESCGTIRTSTPTSPASPCRPTSPSASP